jgi:transposase-like protein
MVRVEKNGRAVLDPQVPEKPKRRKFTAEYKLRILKELDDCTEPGEQGAVLRREGLYSSHLVKWRQQRTEGTLVGLEPKKRGRKAQRKDPLTLEVERLKRENDRLQHRLDQAEVIIEVQKKLSRLLGIKLPTDDENGRND